DSPACCLRSPDGIEKAASGKPPQSAQEPSLIVNCARQRGQYERQVWSVGAGGRTSSSGLVPLRFRNPSIAFFHDSREKLSTDFANGLSCRTADAAGCRISSKTFTAK